MRARLPACRSYLLNEIERFDNRLATRRSRFTARRDDRPRKICEPVSGEGVQWREHRRGTIKVILLLITNRFPFCCASLGWILLLKRDALLPSAAFIVKYAHLSRIIVSRPPRLPRCDPPRPVAERPAKPVVKKLSRANARPAKTRELLVYDY